MSWADLLLILLGFAVSAYGTVVGAGGGFLLVPALLLLYPEYSQREITAISLAVVLASAISGYAAYARRRIVDHGTGVLFAAASIPASFAGAYAVRFLPRSAFDVTFGVLLVGLALFLRYGSQRDRGTIRPPPHGGLWNVRRRIDRGGGAASNYAYDARTGAAMSAATGFVATLFGVGGGVMQVPLMTTVLRMPIDIAVATSQFILVFVALSGTTLHAVSGELGGTELARAALLAVGAIAGAQAGATIAGRLAGETVARMLAGALVLVGIRLLLAPVLS